MTTSDEQLIARYQSSGSPDDLSELVARHVAGVRNLAYRMVLCEATADDVTQDVFAKVMRAAHTFRGEARFATWLYRITLNTAREALRRRPADGGLAPDAGDGAAIHPGQRPDELAMQAELAAEIEHALARLSDKLRAAIVLTAIERHTVKEAAAIEDCSTATMHWRVHQARKQLKLFLHRHLKS